MFSIIVDGLLQYFRQLEEFGGVAALDEDVVILRPLDFQRLFYFFHIIEFPEVTGNVLESLPNQPDIIEMGAFQTLYHLFMFFVADVSQFSHHAEDGHLGTHFHPLEIVKGRSHGSRVGIVGIHYQFVMFGDGQL